MTFKEFVVAWRDNTLDRDAAWRAYDIPAVVNRRRTLNGIRKLGLAYAGELAIPEVMAQYSIASRIEAERMLGSWYVWGQIAAGRFVRPPLRQPKGG
jgi:hypothetical protein